MSVSAPFPNVPPRLGRTSLSRPSSHKSSSVEEVTRCPLGNLAAGKPSLAIHRSIVRTEHPNVAAMARRPTIMPLHVWGARRRRATAFAACAAVIADIVCRP